MSWYSTGSVAVSNGSATINGTGTEWVRNVRKGDMFVGPDGEPYEVQAVVSDIEATLGTPYMGGAATGAAYRMVPTTSHDKELVDGITSILSKADKQSFSYASRADFVAAQAKEKYAVGAVSHAGGVSYRYDGVSTAIPDLPGWAPEGRAYLAHFYAAATDWQPALVAAEAYDGPVYVPAGVTVPVLSAWAPAAPVHLVFEEGARLAISGAISHAIAPAVAGCRFIGVDIDASAATGTDELFYLGSAASSTEISVRRIVGGAVGRQAIYLDGASHCHVYGEGEGQITDIGSSGITLTGATCADNVIEGLYFARVTPGLCVAVNEGSHHNIIRDLRSEDTGAELVGVQWSAHHNEIENCHADRAEDAGFSITGYRNTLIGCSSTASEFHGFAIFGHENTLIGCWAEDNGTLTPGTYSGFSMLSNFGGVARDNRLIGCAAADLTGVQGYGLRFWGHSYGAWSAGLAVGLREFRFNGNNLYEAKNAGTTGATAPTHTSGEVSDGAVTWRYVTTDAEGFRPRDNRADVKVHSASVAPLQSAGVAYNEWTTGKGDRQADEIREEITSEWATGVAVTFGEIRFARTSSGEARRYIAVTAGTTGATKPSHTSGNASDGGVTWRYLGNGQSQTMLDVAGSGARALYGLRLISPTGTERKVHMPNTSPEGLVNGNVGDIALRFGGGPGISAYIKEIGNGNNAGWSPFLTRLYGAKASRPTGLSTGHSGLQYWATDTDEQLIWSGTAWRTISTVAI